MDKLPTNEEFSSESNSSVSFTFKWCAILTGIVGVITNGVVLAALLSKENVKKDSELINHKPSGSRSLLLCFLVRHLCNETFIHSICWNFRLVLLHHLRQRYDDFCRSNRIGRKSGIDSRRSIFPHSLSNFP